MSTLYLAEAPAVYQVKPPVVVDASAICSLLFDEVSREQVVQVLKRSTLFAPTLLTYEVASVALEKHKSGLSLDRAAEAVDDFCSLEVEFREVNVAEQLDLAIRYGLTTYDAAYLWLSAHLKAPLLTLDKKLAEAATVHLGGL